MTSFLPWEWGGGVASGDCGGGEDGGGGEGGRVGGRVGGGEGGHVGGRVGGRVGDGDVIGVSDGVCNSGVCGGESPTAVPLLVFNAW